ncbi:hypothetical protein ACIRH0_18760 [Streptomyces sp. NPDC093675]|uniref:hypothetical protein n=1 Tax=Streptomyces sp. NPDC093675 TaxID=3366049 RepID=UPI0037F3E5F4
MTEVPDFGVSLAHLLHHRSLDVEALADQAGVKADEVRAVLADGVPGEELLRRLAVALGFHAVDLLILAGLPVPDDMAPLDAGAERLMPCIVMDAVCLPVGSRRELLELVRSLPQEERRSSFTPKWIASVGEGPGDRVIRMLRYRNLDRMGMAKALAVVTPTYLSAATYGLIGSGRTELTPRLLTDFAAVLGIDAYELAALTGVFLHGAPSPPAPAALYVATLLWEARRLSAGQAQNVAELARSMRRDPGNEGVATLSGT